MKYRLRVNRQVRDWSLLQVFTGGFGSTGGDANNTPEPESHHRTPLQIAAESEPKVFADSDRKSRDFVGDDDVRQSPRESLLTIFISLEMVASKVKEVTTK